MKKARKTGKRRRSNPKTAPIFFAVAAVQRTADDAADYARFDSSAEIWIKAKTKDEARASIRQQLADGGWRLSRFRILDEVTAGFARIGAMLEPTVYSEDEADEWTKQYWAAEAEGFSCAIVHFTKEAPRRPKLR